MRFPRLREEPFRYGSFRGAREAPRPHLIVEPLLPLSALRVAHPLLSWRPRREPASPGGIAGSFRGQAFGRPNTATRHVATRYMARRVCADHSMCGRRRRTARILTHPDKAFRHGTHMADTKALFTQRFDAARTAWTHRDEPAAAESLRGAIVAARSDPSLRRELASALFHLG